MNKYQRTAIIMGASRDIGHATAIRLANSTKLARSLKNHKEKTMIELYEFALSGNCHKVRLMLGLLGLNYSSIAVNSQLGEHKSAEFIQQFSL